MYAPPPTRVKRRNRPQREEIVGRGDLRLVHRAWHGGWCWEKLVPEVEARGHRAVAPDLPCEDLDAKWQDYGRRVADAVPGLLAGGRSRIFPRLRRQSVRTCL